MLNDLSVTYTYDGVAFITVDGIDYGPAALRMLIWRGRNLVLLIALALLFGVVIGGALVLSFIG